MQTVLPKINEAVIREKLNSLYPGFKYRTHQYETILKILNTIFCTQKRYIILVAPTGSGKSWIARQVAEVYNVLMKEYYDQSKIETSVSHAETLFLTKTISLQNQYLRDFPEIKKLMGASNYSCHSDRILPIEPKLKAHFDCKYTVSSKKCEYNEAREAYFKSKLKILNYSFYTTGLDKYQTKGLLICDEGHNFEEFLLDSFAFELSLIKMNNELTQINIDLTKHLGNLTSITQFTNQLAETLRQIILEALNKFRALKLEYENEITDCKTEFLVKLIEENIKPLDDLISRYEKLSLLMYLLQVGNLDYWVINFDKETYTFSLKPVFVPVCMKRHIFEQPEAVLFMSATGERIKEALNFEDEETELINIDYTFPLQNRPFYIIKGMPSLNKSTFESSFPLYVKVIDSIIKGAKPDTNIIIHSVSYYNADKYYELSSLKSRIRIPRGEEVRELEKSIKKGEIIISPSITEGIDLGNGKAAINIFLKVPYGFLGDPWVVRKMELDDGWYTYNAMLNIIQGVGRGIRSATDEATAFILDPAFNRLFSQTKKYIPEWFIKTMKDIKK